METTFILYRIANPKKKSAVLLLGVDNRYSVIYMELKFPEKKFPWDADSLH